jgi:hypothetical protein
VLVGVDELARALELVEAGAGRGEDGGELGRVAVAERPPHLELSFRGLVDRPPAIALGEHRPVGQ